MIEVKNLCKSFEDKDVLIDINAVFEDGKTNLIIGQSGSGKTVLMKNIVGLFEPTSGQILYDGRDFVQMSKRERVLIRREMGMIFLLVAGTGLLAIVAITYLQAIIAAVISIFGLVLSLKNRKRSKKKSNVSTPRIFPQAKT